MAAYGWRHDHAGFRRAGGADRRAARSAVPAGRRRREPKPAGAATDGAASAGKVLGLPPNVTFSLLAGAAFLCCVPMAMPASHLIALCGDIGLSPARGRR